MSSTTAAVVPAIRATRASPSLIFGGAGVLHGSLAELAAFSPWCHGRVDGRTLSARPGLLEHLALPCFVYHLVLDACLHGTLDARCVALHIANLCSNTPIIFHLAQNPESLPRAARHVEATRSSH
eukprot:5710771-Amphidinium_carterae.1